jgi:hypothetical protein
MRAHREEVTRSFVAVATGAVRLPLPDENAGADWPFALPLPQVPFAREMRVKQPDGFRPFCHGGTLERE